MSPGDDEGGEDDDIGLDADLEPPVVEARSDPAAAAAEEGGRGGLGVDAESWRRAFRESLEASGGLSAAPELPQRPSTPAPPPTKPDVMYPPSREAPNTTSSLFDEGQWSVLYGVNAPPMKRVDPLPPVGSVFFFRVTSDDQPVHKKPSPDSRKVALRSINEVVQVTDFQGAWVRLACETEAEAEEEWEGWMRSEGNEGTLLEEIEDPGENEREFTKNLFRRIWKVNDHVLKRIRERTPRALQYLAAGRAPPGKKDDLPEGTRCLNAFWGLEARFVKLGPKQEYWPQGALTLGARQLKGGWEQPPEEARSGHWRVFAARPFGAHELVEVCPLVKIEQLEACMCSLQTRMNVIETPAEDPGSVSGRVWLNIPLGYGMLYQQSIELWDVSVNWEPVQNFNCKMIAAQGHMYVYTTRRVQAGEELILEYKRSVRSEKGVTVELAGYTPYWCREGLPESFAKALVSAHGPRKVRPIPGRVKYGKSRLHGRGAFADAAYRRGEIIEMCPCLVLDSHGADCMRDYCVSLAPVEVLCGDRKIVKRNERVVLPLGCGGLYNHLEQGKGENVNWLYDETTQCVVFVAAPQADACDEIVRNEELCFDYGEGYWNCDARKALARRGKCDVRV